MSEKPKGIEKPLKLISLHENEERTGLYITYMRQTNQGPVTEDQDLLIVDLLENGKSVHKGWMSPTLRGMLLELDIDPQYIVQEVEGSYDIKELRPPEYDQPVE